MTIFLTVLKKLIKEKLTKVSSDLQWQAGYPLVYTQALSLQKKDIIDQLELEIQDFKCTGDDDADAKEITKKIGEFRVKIQKKQEDFGKKKDEGDTLEVLSNLIFHVDAFYKQLLVFNEKEKGENKLVLINKPCCRYEPAGIVYYHSACYYAGEIFTPASNIDRAIRVAKEEAVRARAQALNERITPEMGLEKRKEVAMEALKDLASDNLNIISPKSKGGYSLPFFTLAGVVSLKLPSDWFNPSEGRFGQEFNLAVSLVQDLTELEFKTKFKIDPEVKVPEAAGLEVKVPAQVVFNM